MVDRLIPVEDAVVLLSSAKDLDWPFIVDVSSGHWPYTGRETAEMFTQVTEQQRLSMRDYFLSVASHEQLFEFLLWSNQSGVTEVCYVMGSQLTLTTDEAVTLLEHHNTPTYTLEIEGGTLMRICGCELITKLEHHTSRELRELAEHLKIASAHVNYHVKNLHLLGCQVYPVEKFPPLVDCLEKYIAERKPASIEEFVEVTVDFLKTAVDLKAAPVEELGYFFVYSATVSTIYKDNSMGALLGGLVSELVATEDTKYQAVAAELLRPSFMPGAATRLERKEMTDALSADAFRFWFSHCPAEALLGTTGARRVRELAKTDAEFARAVTESGSYTSYMSAVELLKEELTPLPCQVDYFSDFLRELLKAKDVLTAGMSQRLIVPPLPKSGANYYVIVSFEQAIFAVNLCAESNEQYLSSVKASIAPYLEVDTSSSVEHYAELTLGLEKVSKGLLLKVVASVLSCDTGLSDWHKAYAEIVLPRLASGKEDSECCYLREGISRHLADRVVELHASGVDVRYLVNGVQERNFQYALLTSAYVRDFVGMAEHSRIYQVCNYYVFGEGSEPEKFVGPPGFADLLGLLMMRHRGWQVHQAVLLSELLNTRNIYLKDAFELVSSA